MKTIQGYAYRFGNERFISLDPVVGGKPARIQLADDVKVKAVTRHEAYVDGKRVSMRALVDAGKARVEEPKAKPTTKRTAKRTAKATKKAVRA